MLFFTTDFLVFLAAVYGLYWLALRRPGPRLNLLLAASWLFYMTWSAKCLLLLLLVTVVDYWLSCAIARSVDPARRKRLLALSVLSNLTLLAVFKYANFLLGSASELARLFGARWSPPALDIVLPLGISFYTFESLSYTIDVYWELAKPARSLRDYALFISYFPHVIAGPILRARDFLPQLESLPAFSSRNLALGFNLFLLGMVKKRFFADRFAVFVDAYFQAPQRYDGLSAWLAVVAYAFQIYCDFSAYSDMARGLGRMFGFDIPVNFDAPYLSRNISEFWQRWHITLSSWLRDYLFFPLALEFRRPGWLAGDLLITMLLGGLWHGANWTFVVWGAYHGVLLGAFWLIQTRWPSAAEPGSFWARAWRAVGSRVSLFALVCVGWVFFRAQTLSAAAFVLGKMAGLHAGGLSYASPWNLAADRIVLLVALMVLYDVCADRLKRMKFSADQAVLRLPPLTAALGYAGAVVLFMFFCPDNASPFIYFQF